MKNLHFVFTIMTIEDEQDLSGCQQDLMQTETVGREGRKKRNSRTRTCE